MDSNDQSLVGEQVSTCVLERMIGAGGMGVVYLARQTRPSRHVAVKLLKPSVGLHTEAYQEFLTRFRREADVIAQLDHINILPIYEYGEANNLAYLIMPYLNGGSLRTLLSERGTFSPKEALVYIEQAASALQYAHDHKIVHRDIKPANMLFHSDGRLVLVDFGIARILHDSTEESAESITRTGNFMGSVEYMAPEMVQGRPVDYRADIYELGIVLYQLLSGRVPFRGSSPFALAAMHIQDLPQPLMELKPTISPEINAVVQKALAKSPDERYQSVLEFAEAYRLVVSPSMALLHEQMQLAGDLAYKPWPNTHSINDNQTQPTSNPDLPFSSPGNAGTPSNPGISNSIDAGTADNAVRPNTMYPPEHYTPTVVPPPSPAQNYLSQQQQQSQYQAYPYPPVIMNTPQSYQTLAQGRGTQHVLPEAGTTYSHSASNQPLPRNRRPEQRHTALPWLISLLALCVIGLVAFIAYTALPQLSGHTIQLTPTAIVQSTPTPATQPTPTPTPTPTSNPSQLAAAAVQTYFSDINQQDYESAYQQWDPNSSYRKATPYTQFSSGFANTIHDDATITGTSQNADGSYTVAFILDSTESTNSGNIVKHFRGSYNVADSSGQWEFESAQVVQA
ncbi:serine/threonine protein kinase [Ktedonobacteria bacterium brp13]|nr:serine/threonine protein kinase [Ktedonobacteria bacterium brp13]